MGCRRAGRPASAVPGHGACGRLVRLPGPNGSGRGLAEDHRVVSGRGRLLRIEADGPRLRRVAGGGGFTIGEAPEPDLAGGRNRGEMPSGVSRFCVGWFAGGIRRDCAKREGTRSSTGPPPCELLSSPRGSFPSEPEAKASYPPLLPPSIGSLAARLRLVKRQCSTARVGVQPAGRTTRIEVLNGQLNGRRACRAHGLRSMGFGCI